MVYSLPQLLTYNCPDRILDNLNLTSYSPKNCFSIISMSVPIWRFGSFHSCMGNCQGTIKFTVSFCIIIHIFHFYLELVN